MPETPYLTFADVLKQEYEHFNDGERLPLLGLKDVARLASRLRDAGADDRVAAYFRRGLPPEAERELSELDDERGPSERLRAALALRYDKVLGDPQLYQGQTGEELTGALRAAGLGGFELPRDAQRMTRLQWTLVNSNLLHLLYPGTSGATPTVASVVQFLHEAKHSAVCLSGGGIRSATFNLGLLQGLARHGLLERFDYLSTVSGGGFIGGWLSAWVHRHERGLDGVVDELSDPPPPDRVLEPDPRPLSWLRTYSNYLSPKLGLLNADTWTLIAMVLRNMLLNWLVFIPWLVAALLVPRLWVAFAKDVPVGPSGLGALVVGWLAGVIFLCFVARNLPSLHKTDRDDPNVRGQGSGQGRYLLFNLLPVVVTAAMLSIYWARIDEPTRARLGWLHFSAFAGAMVIIPWILTIHFARRKNREYATWPRLVGMTVAVAGGLLITGYATYKAAALLLGHVGGDALRPDPRFYATLAVPALILLLSLGGTLLAGLTSRATGDEDQEWWARAGAWMLIVVIAWAALCALVLYGPSLFIDLQIAADNWRFWTWDDAKQAKLGKIFGIVSGVVSGAVALFGGFSSKTPANEKEAQQAGIGSKALSLLTPVLAGLFMIFLVMLFSYVAHSLLAGAGASPLEVINGSTVGRIALLGAVIIGVGVVMGIFISTNRFSLHYMWRNRIIRAYLGASHTNRKPNLFTGFDALDNIPMGELANYAKSATSAVSERPKRKLFHVLNFALNLAGGGRLDWQDRKSESFTASPLHCGSFQPAVKHLSPEGAVGYRPSAQYTADGGITLGTSVAISGAFVSPNMGYMMTSPLVRFLMTLFNVRFGWWLGNPRNRKTYKYDSPALSILPIVQEAFGMTNDTSPYVYLSDGGHFENLGIYEMVARRCNFIVVSDASTDNDYSFGSLGMAVRQIRVDLGVPIEFEDFAVVGAKEGKDGRACALGVIKYSCVDPGAPDGVVVYVKPTLTGKEPRDVLNYARDNQSFPQEVIVDQWFSEAQFESYRTLGSYIVNDLTGGSSRRKLSFEEFGETVRDYISRTAPNDEISRTLAFFQKLANPEPAAGDGNPAKPPATTPTTARSDGD
ncbi:MAG TPA: patatin-like phospholipase family protein [Pyrinomonadaceae bacterium]|nr:patatin-like phospholipase family protein [Pyrinomonadaceae bacterium]